MKYQKFTKEVFDEIKNKGLECLIDIKKKIIKIYPVGRSSKIIDIYEIRDARLWYDRGKIPQCSDGTYEHNFHPKFFDHKKKELRGYMDVPSVGNPLLIKV